jgi:D-cysteine desulfhydrase family pyridoxal phosphate-dependent enzyme
VNLAFLPTPLQELPRLSRFLGGPRLLMKRDDQTGLAFGGNKARKLEFLMADALAQGADTIVTTAAAHSNMLRMTCAAARQLGLQIHLIMRGTGQEAVQGNLLLHHLFGADMTFIPTTDPYSQLSLDTMDRVVTDLKARGRRPYVIDLRYQSGGLAALGYVAAAAELAEQFASLGIERPTLVCSTGSGGTQAGLLLGNALMQADFKVIGISVQQSVAKMVPRIAEKINQASEILGVEVEILPEQIVIDDRWIGPAYGVPTPACIEAIKLAARYEGVVLDPVYSGKGLSGLIGLIQAGSLSPSETVVFIHTGGSPALFTFNLELLPDLQSDDRIIEIIEPS